MPPLAGVLGNRRDIQRQRRLIRTEQPELHGHAQDPAECDLELVSRRGCVTLPRGGGVSTAVLPRLWLQLGVGASVRDGRACVRSRAGANRIKGAGRRPVLTPQQQVALVAHELAQGVNGDPVRGSFVGSAIDALQAWYDLLHPGVLWEPERGLMAYPVLLSNLLMRGLAQLAYGATFALSVLAWRDSQRAEYLADDFAVQVAGADPKLGLLAATSQDAVVDLALQGLALGRDEGGLLDALERASASLPSRERERLRRAGLLEDARVDATHPPTALRIAMIERRPHGPAQVILSDEEGAAIRAELQRREEPLRRRLTDRYCSRLYAG